MDQYGSRILVIQINQYLIRPIVQIITKIYRQSLSKAIPKIYVIKVNPTLDSKTMEIGYAKVYSGKVSFRLR